MAQYFEDWSDSDVSDNPPAGWTKKWVTTQPFTVVTDADNPTGEGKSVEAVPTSSSRCALTWDAVDADADRATCDLIALIEVFEAANTGAYTYGGLVGRVAGSASSETGVTGSMGHSANGATNHDVRVTQYSSGSLTTSADDVQNTWVNDTRYWLRLTLSGTSARVRLYPEADPLDDGALLADHSTTVSVTGAGGVGIWSFTTNGSIRYLCVGCGTNGDLPPTSAGSDTTAPVLTSPTGTATGTTTATVGATTDEGNGTMYAVVTTSSTAPSVSQIKAGQDHTGSAAVWDGPQAISTTGAKTLNATGLTAATGYYAHIVHTDAAANDSNVVTSSQFTTDASDTTAPTLTSPTGSATGATTATVGATTDEGNGTLYAVVTTSASAPSASQVKAGNDHTGSAAVWSGNQAISTTGAKTLNATGLTASTGYYAHLVHTDAATNDSNVVSSAQFTTHTSTSIAVVAAIDGGNVDADLVTITDAASLTPTIELDVRSASVSSLGWWNVVFQLTGANGKTPLFKVNRATNIAPSTTPPSSWLPAWTADTTDHTSWVRASTLSKVGGSSGTYEWSFDSAFDSDTVIVAMEPMGRVSDADALATELLAETFCSPAPSADAGGVFHTSPTENDEDSRAIGGHDMYALELDWGGSTNDGGPKRIGVLGAQIHAQGESCSWITFRYFLDWLINSSDAQAVALRANWKFYVYFAITPNGLYGGHRRFNFRVSTDPNRDWASTTLSEITALKAAIETDTTDGGRFDAQYIFHAGYTTTNPARAYFTPEDESSGTRGVVIAALGAAVGGYLSQTMLYDSSGTSNTAPWWAKTQKGVRCYADIETPALGSTALTQYQNIAQAWGKSLGDLDAAGMFVITGTLSSTDDDDVLEALGDVEIEASLSSIDEDDLLIAMSLAPQESMPAEDITAGGWLPSEGSQLYAVLDDQSDADYAYTETLSAFEVALEAMTDPLTHVDHVIEYRIEGDGTTDIVVSLKQGDTTIESWTHSPAPVGFTTYSQTLDEGVAATITNYSDLRLRFEAA